MTKLDIAIKAVACLVVGFIIAGLTNGATLEKFIPFILGGTALVMVLYVINAFKKRSYSKIITIVIAAAFAVGIAVYRMLG